MPSEQKIPRPRNAFIFFRSYYNANPLEFLDSPDQMHTDQNSVSCAAGAVWRSYNPDQKQRFIDMAEEERERYAVVYPNYSYGSGGVKKAKTRRASVSSAASSKKVKKPTKRERERARRRRVSLPSTATYDDSPSPSPFVPPSSPIPGMPSSWPSYGAPPSPSPSPSMDTDEPVSPQSSKSSTPPPLTPSVSPKQEQVSIKLEDQSFDSGFELIEPLFETNNVSSATNNVFDEALDIEFVEEPYNDWILGSVSEFDAVYDLDAELDQFSMPSIKMEDWDTFVDPVFPSYGSHPSSLYNAFQAAPKVEELPQGLSFFHEPMPMVKIEEEVEF